MNDRVVRGVKDYKAQYDWPEDCFIQGGGNGVVFTEGSMTEVFKDPVKGVDAVNAVLGKKTSIKHYRTAFFEAFPREPNTFIRGEGQTVAEAEAGAWQQFQKFNKCKGHEFERRGYENGAGFCKHCSMFSSNVFKPSAKWEAGQKQAEKEFKAMQESWKSKGESKG